MLCVDTSRKFRKHPWFWEKSISTRWRKFRKYFYRGGVTPPPNISGTNLPCKSQKPTINLLKVVFMGQTGLDKFGSILGRIGKFFQKIQFLLIKLFHFSKYQKNEWHHRDQWIFLDLLMYQTQNKKKSFPFNFQNFTKYHLNQPSEVLSLHSFYQQMHITL